MRQRVGIAVRFLDGILDSMQWQQPRAFSLPFIVLLWIWVMPAAAGCSKSDGELVGFGPYRFDKTKLKDAYGCREEKGIMHCLNNPSPVIAGHQTQADLYFDGTTDDAPLVEIFVGVWNCQPGKVGADLQAKLGKATEQRDRELYWKRENMFVVAFLPDPDQKDLCTLHFLSPDQTERLQVLHPVQAPSEPAASPHK